jgi:hypothetical protein
MNACFLLCLCLVPQSLGVVVSGLWLLLASKVETAKSLEHYRLAEIRHYHVVSNTNTWTDDRLGNRRSFARGRCHQTTHRYSDSERFQNTK